MKIKYSAKDQSYVIVGGNSTIGKKLCEFLLNAGAHVHSVDIPSSTPLESQANYHTYDCFPQKEKEVIKAVEAITQKTSKVHGLVCLSGAITAFKPIADLSYEKWQEMLDINLSSCFNSAKYFNPLLQSTKDSAIVNMSSGLANISNENYGAYSAAKAAIISLTKTLARELAPTTRVNAIAPGAVDTPFLLDQFGKNRIDLAIYKNMVPLDSLANTSEIAHGILFLLSEGSSHITGQTLHVNGGGMMV